MDNYAKILMKKLFLTIIIAFATVCGFAQEKAAITDYHFRGGTVHFNGQFINGVSQDFLRHFGFV